jgi:glycosyltransferase involved in cell wall biosynthesis
MNTRVCFLGGARYDRPLMATNEKKFRAMKSLADLFVIGFSRDWQSRRFTEHAHFYLLPQLPLPFLRYLELFLVGQLLVLWLIMRRRIQVVVTQSPYEGFIAALAIRLAKCFGRRARLVVEVHGDFERSLFLYREIRFAGLHRFLMSCLARYSIKHADLLRAVSSSTREQLQAWAPGKAVVQFQTWTDIETFLRCGPRSDPNGSELILYAGVLNPLKGIHDLIGAFALVAGEFPRAQLVIIGKDEDKTYAAALRRQITGHALEQRVRFVGSMPQAELATWMANAAVVVLPSRSEGLPRVLIEAMATGTAVIGSRVGGIPELIEDGASGFLIAPGDRQTLAEKLRWILRYPDQARHMGACGRAFAERLFSTKRYLEGYERVFAVAAARSGS